MFLILIYFNFVVHIDTYDKTYFVGVNDKRNENELLKSYEIYDEGNYTNYIDYLSEKIKPIDFSREGIICEFIIFQENSKGNIYAVLYEDKTMKYVTESFNGNFRLLPTIENEDFEIFTGRKVEINNINKFFIKGECIEKTINISDIEYVNFISRLKLLKILSKGEKKFDVGNDFIKGIYFNSGCYLDSPLIKKNCEETIISNILKYFEECICRDLFEE